MHGIRGPYLIQLRTGPRRDRLPGSEIVDGKTFAFRPGWTLGPELGGIYAGELAMVTCDPAYPDAAPTWLPSGDLVTIGAGIIDLVEQAK
jgi:hypothetical protein